MLCKQESDWSFTWTQLLSYCKVCHRWNWSFQGTEICWWGSTETALHPLARMLLRTLHPPDASCLPELTLGAPPRLPSEDWWRSWGPASSGTLPEAAERLLLLEVFCLVFPEWGQLMHRGIRLMTWDGSSRLLSRPHSCCGQLTLLQRHGSGCRGLLSNQRLRRAVSVKLILNLKIHCIDHQ